MNRILTLLMLLTVTTVLYSQQEDKTFVVRYTEAPPVLDGDLEDAIWSKAQMTSNFWQYFPTDSLYALKQTEIRMLYDETTLYLGVKVLTEGDEYVIPSLQRDYRAGGNDNISFLFDTFNDGTNAYLFGMNPLGVMREALISGGGSDLRGFTTSWDVKWKGEAKSYPTYYSLEMAIPLSSFKFKDGETKWRFNSYRFNTLSNEESTWARIPQNQFIFNLAFMGDMVFEKPLNRSRTPLTLIPYVNVFEGKDFENDDDSFEVKFGGDAKIAIGSGMNLDITVNPDFSQVEVDDQVTNLSRFEVSLPEKRQFFIDNNDLFGDFGFAGLTNPFFSRRIGIAEDLEGDLIANDIIGGIRLSGKLNSNLRLGFLSIQTEEDELNEIPSNNNSVLVLQQKVFARSNIGVIFVNRQTFEDYDFLQNIDRYNRVTGLEYNLASADNTWVGKAYIHKSFTDRTAGQELSSGASLIYNSRKLRSSLTTTYVGADYQADLGFILREDIFSIEPNVELLFWPTRGKINNHLVGINAQVLWRPGLAMQNTDNSLAGYYELAFKNQAGASAVITHRYIYLTEEFEPTGEEDAIPLPADTGYSFTGFEASYRSDGRKVFSYAVRPSAGQFFSGHSYGLGGEFVLRLQPKFRLAFNARFDRISLPEPYATANLWLLGPRIDVTFSKSVFWATYIQYSTQQDNFGINSRLQWRFAPLSDLFLVYTDNYRIDGFGPRNRSINLKLTYWLNI